MFAVFNQPSVTASNSVNTIDRFLLDAFRCAKRGTRVRGSVDSWYDTDFTRELKDIADEQNLLLRLVTGESSQTGTDSIPEGVQDFFRSIERGIAASVDADGFANHLKFFCFNELEFGMLEELHPSFVVGDHVVKTLPALYLASANIDEDGKHNAAVLVPITEEVRLKLRSYFNDLYSEYEELVNPSVSGSSIFTEIWEWLMSFFSSEPHESHDRYDTISSDLFKLYFFPRTSGEDTIVNVLENIEHHSKRVKSQCTVHLVTPRFRDSRLAVAKALKCLHENGARIEIVTRSEDDKFGDPPESELGNEVASILRGCAHLYFQRSRERDEPKMNIHSKYLLVDGPYVSGNGFVRQKIVWHGTANMTSSGIKSHWEMLMKLYEKSGAYDAFLKDFEFLKDHAAFLASEPT